MCDVIMLRRTGDVELEISCDFHCLKKNANIRYEKHLKDHPLKHHIVYSIGVFSRWSLSFLNLMDA